MIVDSNILIYAARPKNAYLLDWLESAPHRISAISYVEIFGFSGMEAVEQEALEVIFLNLPVVRLTDDVLDKTVDLLRRKRMSLGDSIVAATALLHGGILATANEKDFRHIPGLTVFNPMQPNTAVP